MRFVLLSAILLLSAACRPPAKAMEASCPPLPAAEQAGVSTDTAPARATPKPIFLRGATVWTAAGQVLPQTDVLLEGGLIKAVGQGLEVPDGARVLEGKGKHLTPGIIDPHSHIGVYPAPGGLVGHGDGNEVGKPISASVRVEDAIWPQDPGIPRALEAGVTALHVIPGSANLIGGEGLVIRPLPGRSARDLALAGAPRTIKMACGENPKRVYAEKGGPFTRMGNVARVRAAFQMAREYTRDLKRHEQALAQWMKRREERCSGQGPAGQGDDKDDMPPAPPKVDPELATIAGILSGELKVHMHCYRADEMSVMMELARSFGFSIAAFHHATEAYKVRDRLRAAGTGAVVWINWWGFKAEAMDAIPEAAALLTGAGVTAALHSDSALVIQRLNQEAALAYHRGRDAGLKITEDQALQLVTRGPARLLGIDKLTGSIEVGKLGDLVLWDGHPFSILSRTSAVLVEGRIAYRRGARAGRAGRPTDFELGTVPRPAPLDQAPLTGKEPTLPTGWATPPPAIGPPAQPAAADQPVVIRGATVHTMTGPPIVHGTVVFQGGRVTAVGGPEVSSPAGARFINGSDLVLTPGLVATETAIGLVEIGLEPTARDHYPDGKGLPVVRADLRAWEAFNPHSTAIPVNRVEGFTTALVRPFGGLISGQSAAFDLAGLRPGEAGLRGPLGVHVNLGIPGSRAAGGSRSLAMMHLRRLLDAARDLRKNRAAVDGRRFRDLGYPRTQVLPLVPVIERKVPLVVSVDRAADILDTLRLAAEQKVRVVLSGAAEGWRVADDIARARIPVLVAVDRNLPLSYDALASRYDNAARLHRAGVVIGLSADGQAHNIRFLRQEAGIAAAWGLPRDAALAALTRNPAAIFGLTDRGVLRPGARANLVLWTAHPLGLAARVKQLFIAGREVPVQSRQTELLERYLELKK